MKLLSEIDPSVRSSLDVGTFKGVIARYSNKEYHSLSNYTSSSLLKYMHSKSPVHYKAMYIDKSIEQKEPTDKMILGSLVHCLVLTPDQMTNDFFVMPNINLRTNAGKEERDNLIKENPDKMMIDEEMLTQAMDMTKSCMSNRQAAKLLEPGKKEISFFWQCPFSNLPMRARADSAGSTGLIELKTTTDASSEYFSRHIHNMNYDLSIHHYLEGIRQTMDVSPQPYFIVIEDKPPYVTQVYKVGDSILELGQQKWLDAVTKLERGLKNNDWPGYFPIADEVETIEAPSWALSKSTIEVESNDDIF